MEIITAAVTTAVDKSPAYARLSAIASAGDLPHSPYTTPWEYVMLS